MENKVTSTSKQDLAQQVIPPVSQLQPHPPTAEVSIAPVRSPAIFRPPGLVDSEKEDGQTEDIKPDMMYTPTTFPTSYPSMLRLLHPHLYRHYHPYLLYTNTTIAFQGHR
jgi:hypothetical protein